MNANQIEQLTRIYRMVDQKIIDIETSIHHSQDIVDEEKNWLLNEHGNLKTMLEDLLGNFIKENRQSIFPTEAGGELMLNFSILDGVC